MHLVFTPAARTAFREAYRYLSEHNPTAAEKFYRGLSQALSEMSQNPKAYPVHSTYGSDVVHRYIYKRYHVYYRIHDSCVEIAHILHHARDINSVLSERES